MAGESADAVAASQRDRARRLEESARRWEQGAAGERATATALRSLPPGWVVLHDLAWPGRQRANIDHVLVGPPGVVVLDSKNWSGRVSLDAGILRVGARDRSTAVWGVESAASAIADAVPRIPRDHVHAALCFTGQPGLAGFVGAVLVTSDADLVRTLLARPACLTPRQVWDHAELLRSALGPADGPRATPRQPRAGSPDAASVAATGVSRHRTSGPTRRLTRAVRRVLVGTVVVTVLATQPSLVQGAAEGIGAVVTGILTPSSGGPEAPVADRPTTRERREANQPRRERERQERKERREARRSQERAARVVPAAPGVAESRAAGDR